MFSWNWIRPTGHRSNMRRVWSKLALAATKCRAIFPCLFGVNPISSALILLFLHQNDFRGSCWSNLFLMIFPVDKEMPVFDSGFWKNPEFAAWHPYLFRLNIYCMYSIFMATPQKVETSYPTKISFYPYGGHYSHHCFTHISMISYPQYITNTHNNVIFLYYS